MTELEQYLRTYTGIPDEDMKALTSYFHLTTLEKGDFYVKEGRVCDKLSFQRSGLVRVYAKHDGKDVTQWISSKGYFITDLAGIICNEPSKFDIRALTYSELYTISKKDYLELPKLIPSWPACERILITRCFSFIEKRLFAQLSMTAEEQYKHMLNISPELFTQVPLKYLASMMGMTPESLSRIRNKMAG
ncbi:MAG: cyclic nucleotide-binding protein [Bacteroidetes bacterium]|nr:MAG: cyclic nucleotide-binding protein [Bacteroidota bacterium]